MLCLLGVMLSVLCLVSPAPHTRGTACPASALFKETIHVLQKLRSKGSSEITPLNNTMEARRNAATSLEGFIEALKNSKESEEQRLIILNLQKIQAYGESCTGWRSFPSFLEEHPWKTVEKHAFFSNLENLLRFLGHNALPEETN